MLPNFENLLSSFLRVKEHFSLTKFITKLNLRFGDSSRVYSALSNHQVYLLFREFDLVDSFIMCSCNRVYSFETVKFEGKDEEYNPKFSEFLCKCGGKHNFLSLNFFNKLINNNNSVQFFIIFYFFSLRISKENIALLAHISNNNLNNIFSYFSKLTTCFF